MKRINLLTLFIFEVVFTSLSAQNIRNNPTSNHGNKFEQLGTILSDPNNYRTASGAPGFQYWQMKADYVIDATLDEKNIQLNGNEWITYHNNSPEPLTYMWLQLDENEHDVNSDNQTFNGSEIKTPLKASDIDYLDYKKKLEGLGCKIDEVVDESNRPLRYTINQTMMRVDLNTPLMPNSKIKFRVRWHYKIPDRMKSWGRGGLEYFQEDDNHLFTMTQWYPRMCVYSDFQGWQNRQFTGRGEFALTFGNFEVNMTVPADHIISATGQCQNYRDVLTSAQFKRWEQAQTAKDIIEVVTLDEAKNAEKTKATATKTWRYKAENVRDFAWGSSRKFIWDAKAVNIEGKKVMAMSYYPKEAYNLYRKYSTKVVEHTLKTYSKFTIPYPYPVAISVEASNGMEYPMICFNFGRCKKDGTYTEGTKNGMISVVIHEVGHNFFPMIVNSDERQWSWFDEGLNTFMQYLAEQEFDPNFPASRGPAAKITDYMKLPKEQLEPIMTNSDNIVRFGDNAYGKPATALNILRETVMGRELFDYSFKEYSRRWAFKHPTPADFFRTMEDASAVDLDWFWRAWFYDIEPVDISLDSVKTIAVKDRSIKELKKMKPDVSDMKNREIKMQYAIDRDTSLRDVYYNKVESEAKAPQNLEAVNDSTYNAHKNDYIYQLSFTNKGGTVMPIILQWNYKDGTSEIERISAHIWRRNEKNFTKAFVKNKEVSSIQLDPLQETADIDETNNTWQTVTPPSRFELYKSKQGGGRQ